MLKKILFISFFFLLSNTVSAQKDVKQITKGVINGAAVTLVKPAYPAAAQAIKASGEVKIQVTIDEEGNIISAQTISGHPLLRQAAEQAAWQSKFKPTTLEGRPVKVTGIIVYNFVVEPPPVNELEKDNNIFALGFFLSFLSEADSEILKEMGDEQELDLIVKDMKNDIPEELSFDKELLTKLADGKGSERQQAAAELNNSFKKHFSVSGLREFEVGQAMGVIIVQVYKKVLFLSGKNFQSNDAILRENLSKLNNTVNSGSLKITPSILNQLKEVGKFADSTDLNSTENLQKLFLAITPIFDSLDEK